MYQFTTPQHTLLPEAQAISQALQELANDKYRNICSKNKTWYVLQENHKVLRNSKEEKSSLFRGISQYFINEFAS